MKKKFISKLSILLMAICFCSNAWAEEKKTIKFTVIDMGGAALEDTEVKASSDSENCKIENPIEYTDENGMVEIRVTLKALGTFYITVKFTYSTVVKEKVIEITIREKPSGEWAIQMIPNSTNIIVPMLVAHNSLPILNRESYYPFKFFIKKRINTIKSMTFS